VGRYTGKDGIVTLGGTTINVTNWEITEEAVMEDATDTASSEVDSLIVETEEPVAIRLTGRVEAFHKDDEAIHADPPGVNAGNDDATLVLTEKSGKSWTITACVTSFNIRSAAKGFTKYNFAFRGKTWTRPSS